MAEAIRLTDEEVRLIRQVRHLRPSVRARLSALVRDLTDSPSVIRADPAARATLGTPNMPTWRMAPDEMEELDADLRALDEASMDG